MKQNLIKQVYPFLVILLGIGMLIHQIINGGDYLSLISGFFLIFTGVSIVFYTKTFLLDAETEAVYEKIILPIGYLVFIVLFFIGFFK